MILRISFKRDIMFFFLMNNLVDDNDDEKPWRRIIFTWPQLHELLFLFRDVWSLVLF